MSIRAGDLSSKSDRFVTRKVMDLLPKKKKTLYKSGIFLVELICVQTIVYIICQNSRSYPILLIRDPIPIQLSKYLCIP